MAKSITTLADELLAAGPGGLQDLNVHVFDDDRAAHDDEAIERLYVQFKADLATAQSEISEKYGSPSRTGSADDPAIPLNGVFTFAVWEVDGTELFVAAAHEDRGVPILLMMGTT